MKTSRLGVDLESQIDLRSTTSTQSSDLRHTSVVDDGLLLEAFDAYGKKLLLR